MSDCVCEPPVRNDVAWHNPVCPWRIRRLIEQERGFRPGTIRPENEEDYT